jgi:RNA polymerase sigma-70 factor (ECF subfamily)
MAPWRGRRLSMRSAGGCVTSPLLAAAVRPEDPSWIDAFRRGDHQILADCYRSYYRVVETAIGGLLGAADRETVIHEVFFRLLTDPGMRASFTGPSLGGWLSSIARNRALDVNRRARREVLRFTSDESAVTDGNVRADEEAVMRLLLERFQRDHVPPGWAPLFEARFLREMSQREAARHLGMHRTTLAYQELQLRRRLRRFMLAEEG